ncbi:hypothetical protein [Undibacterium umbellatum]|uniref:Lipoprotein n=1 Tax=Undibacterium umbellatum TaxID=2762300 RepID=A0ABR6Z9E6_9BURK|nr:hypothetical protein [Undibacterium umbellatum]MBC3908199.1 hypothetical protein [Undibacterium umbellatum]
MKKSNMAFIIKKISIALLLSCASIAMAASDKLCTGDAGLKKQEGYWSSSSFLDLLKKHGNWTGAMAATDGQQVALTIKDGQIKQNLAWHEGDETAYCLRLQGDKIWLLGDGKRRTEQGPYQRLGRLAQKEADLYLARIIQGCFVGEEKEQWCFQNGRLSINGKPSKASLSLDLSELDLYGTPLRVEGRKLPFWYLFQRGETWAVFEDDYASNEKRVPVDPKTSKPWRVLRKQ